MMLASVCAATATTSADRSSSPSAGCSPRLAAAASSAKFSATLEPGQVQRAARAGQVHAEVCGLAYDSARPCDGLDAASRAAPAHRAAHVDAHVPDLAGVRARPAIDRAVDQDPRTDPRAEEERAE